MPKIEVFRDALIRSVGTKKISDEELEAIFPVAMTNQIEPGAMSPSAGLEKSHHFSKLPYTATL